MKLTLEEINALITLINIATKAAGLDVAQPAVHLAGKLQAMAKELDAPEAPAAAPEKLKAV